MSIRVETKRALLDVIVTDDLEERDLSVLLNAMEAAARRGPFVVLTDTTAMKAAPRAVLKSFAERLKQMPSMKQVWMADAVVANSAVTRFLLSTLILIAPMPTSVKVFDNRDQAEQWCWLMLQRAQSTHNAMS